MKEVRVLLVDDHALVRDSLSTRLAQESGIVVVATTATADEAVAEARRQSPDVVVMDIDMPGMSCFDAATRIMARSSDVRVLFLSAYTSDRYIEEALRVGGLGYLTKAEPPANVIEAIRAVASGQVWFSAEILSRLVSEGDRVRLATSGRSRTATLTPREMEVLRYLAQGHSKREIAEIMHVTLKTVDKHSENLMRKVDIHDRVKLARFAIREGIAEL